MKENRSFKKNTKQRHRQENTQIPKLKAKAAGREPMAKHGLVEAGLAGFSVLARVPALNKVETLSNSILASSVKVKGSARSAG